MTLVQGRCRAVLKAIATVLLVGVALHVIGPRRLLDTLSDVQVGTLIVAGLLAATSIALLLVRWVAMVLETVRLPLREHARIYLWGTFLNSFTPANVGGDVYRVARLRPTDGRRSTIVGHLLRERVLGLLGYLIGLALSVAIWATTGDGVPQLFVVAGAVALAGAVAVMVVPRLLPALGRIPAVRRWTFATRALRFAESSLGLGPLRPALGLLALSLLSWLAWVGAVLVVAADLDLGLEIAAVAAVACVSELVRLLPITFQGIGVRESTFAALSVTAGGTAAEGFATATVAYLLLTLVLMLCGPASWLAVRGRQAADQPPASSSSRTSTT